LISTVCDFLQHPLLEDHEDARWFLRMLKDNPGGVPGKGILRGMDDPRAELLLALYGTSVLTDEELIDCTTRGKKQN
jgi:hypothetical protein